LIDAPFIQAVENPSSRSCHRSVQSGQTERVTERACRHSRGPIF
jgi:hypothetical protein